MTHEDDILKERLLTMIGESSPTVTVDQVLERSRAGRQLAGARPRATRSRNARPTLTVGWVVGIVVLVAAAIFGFAAANQGPSKVSALHSHGSQPKGKLGHNPPPPPPSGTSVSTSTTFKSSSHNQPTPTTAPSVPHGPALEIFDVTWTNVNDGWAVVNKAGCASVCPELVTTTSGGETWQNVAPLPSGACSMEGCADITFVNSHDGYLFYTQNGYWITTDGGSTWTQQAGRSVLSFEPFGNDVLRVSYSHSGCPGPCDVTVDEAAPGSTDWTTLTAPQQADGAQLVTEGADDAYLALFQNPAGGAGSAHATLLVTDDGGGGWSTVTDPCGTVDGDEYDTSAITAAPGPEVFVLCTDRVGESSQFLEKSADPTEGFESGPMLPAGPFDQIAATSPTHVVLGTGPVNYYDGPRDSHTFELIDSTDGGSQWSTTANDHGTQDNEVVPNGFLGFESAQLGWWVADPRYIWATGDGGSQWTRSEVSVSS
jgi:hypothetical protein